ncbi:sensor histidine kinase [Lentzea nigeriaca]|uniref:sensor histidine kinase n=1 Tax=Lentzea nigeriaca TaxID=1128665 RepID=UPI00195C4E43|nr:histidine kinase [Lentzea nigeriaca]MBM7864434.1 signal transduction histidine kinase [Lentzea nigeriaca]
MTRLPRVTDDYVFRPFGTLVVAVITVIHLVDRPPPLPALTWTLTAAVITAAVAAGFTARMPERWRVALITAYVVLSAPLFALGPGTAAVAFVFLATSTAGRRLRSVHVASALGVAGSVLTVLSTAAAGSLGFSDAPPWWLSATAGLPVFFGLARRARTEALAAAEYAAEQSKRALASEARAAALEERGRIAREIHDVVGHSLSGIAVQLDMADALHSAGKESEANEAVRRARALAVTGLKETRRAVHALRVDTLPLPESIAQLAESHGATLRVAGEAGPVTVEIAQAIIRTAQEALTNAHKHAPGADVSLLLEYSEELVSLTVTDGGTAGEQHTGGGMGLAGMRERAALLGGTLIAGPDGPGWTVRMELPR